MLDLEQHIGSEITWLRSHIGFEELIQNVKKMIPNRRHRLCTSILKIDPIFWYLYLKGALPCQMRIGFRYDEKERAENFTTTYKFTPYSYPEGKRGWVKHWRELTWRTGDFVLIKDQVGPLKVNNYWDAFNIDFPIDSNCLFCFHKPIQQLRQNFQTQLPTMAWATVMEALMDATFHDKYSFQEIARIGVQLDFEYGGGSGCQAGFCTD
jgi:hypothetical protein